MMSDTGNNCLGPVEYVVDKFWLSESASLLECRGRSLSWRYQVAGLLFLAP
jgi:hypothetical protein